MKPLSLPCLLAAALLPALASAEPPSAPLQNLTLERAIEIALQAHPILAESAASLEAARARAAAAGRLPNPEFGARVESAPLSSGTISEADYLVGFSQPIPLGRRLSAERELENAGVNLRQNENEAAAWNLIRSVRSAFATALYTSRVAQAQAALAADLDELLRVTRARIDQGDAAPLDLLRLEAEAAQHRLELDEASRLHRQAMHALAAALGNFETPIESLEGDLEHALAIHEIKARPLLLNENPNLAVLESAAEMQRARVRLEKSERIPDVNLDLFYRRLQGARENAFDVGVRVPIPLFDRKRGRVREAESGLRAAEARYERARNEIGLELRSLELALERALASAAVLRSEVLPRMQATLRGAEARYAAGDTSLSDLLLIRREATAAQLQHLETLRAILESWATLANRSGTAN